MDREEILSRFERWSNDLGLIVTRIDDPTADFHVAISQPHLPMIDIVHPTIDSKFVLFSTRLTVTEDDQKKMLNLALEQREELLWDIKLKLLSMNVEFRVLRPEGPTSWEMHTKVFLEGMTAQRFSDAYLKVKNAGLYVIWSYRRILDRKIYRM